MAEKNKKKHCTSVLNADPVLKPQLTVHSLFTSGMYVTAAANRWPQW